MKYKFQNKSCPSITLLQLRQNRFCSIPVRGLHSHPALHLLHFQHLITHIRFMEVWGELGVRSSNSLQGELYQTSWTHVRKDLPYFLPHKSFLTLFIWLQEWWLSQPMAWVSSRFTPGGTLAIVHLKELPWPLTSDRSGSSLWPDKGTRMELCVEGRGDMGIRPDWEVCVWKWILPQL